MWLPRRISCAHHMDGELKQKPAREIREGETLKWIISRGCRGHPPVRPSAISCALET